MKCPHCNTGIHAGFTTSTVITYTAQYAGAKGLKGNVHWNLMHMRCPECEETIIRLQRLGPEPGLHFSAYPRSASRPIPKEVPNPYRDDFSEACKVLADSAKASAALSRRCLQGILRDQAATKAKNLADQIDEVIQSGSVPPHVQGELDAVRVIGNFAAHPTKSTATGEIIDVEPGEAEWNLDVLESLFEFYFVQPGLTATRKAALNVKLKAAGKPEIP